MGRTNNNPSLDQWIQIDYEALDILTNDIEILLKWRFGSWIHDKTPSDRYGFIEYGCF